MQQSTQTTIEEPPQGLYVPHNHHVIKLNPEDAARFHAGLEHVRALLPEHGKHWLKNKGPEDFLDPQNAMLGIEMNGDLVAGCLVSAYTRALGNKLTWYPWWAAGEHTGLISSVWVKHEGFGLGKALIQQAKKEIADNPRISPDPLKGGLKYVLAGVAENNLDSRALFSEKRGFKEIYRLEADPIHGKPMVYMRHLMYPDHSK